MEQDHGPLAPTQLTVAPDAFIAPSAILVGRVTLASQASVWYGCVLRGDLEPIEVGERTNIQDLTVVHVDRGLPALIGRDVTIGHRALIHGAVIEDGALIGMGAIVLSGARVGAGALVAAGAVVREGFHVPPGAVCAGVPGRIIGAVDEPTGERIRRGCDSYVVVARQYRSGALGGGPHGGR